jgi:TRAP-type C4-dicarboxylate transport system substrate-binding protein
MEERMSPRHNSHPVAMWLAAAMSAAVLTGAPPAFAQDKTIELKLSHWVPPSHPLQKAIEEWGAAVEKASNGTIKYKVYPSQQLGKAFDHYDMARDGIADLTYVSPGYQPGRFPLIDASNLPFMASNAKEGTAALDEWYRKYAATEMKDVKFCFAFLHDPGTFHSKTKKIVVPGDIKGMKIRPAHATTATLVTQLGGTNVQASAPEVRDIIDKGVADAVTFPWGSILLFGIDKVTKYHMDAALYTTSFVWVMNKPKYDSMSANQKKAIDDNCNTEAAVRLASPWADFEHAGIAKLKAEPGHEVYPLTPAQLTEWRQASEPVVKAWGDQVRKGGGDPDTALNELKQTLARHNSLIN